MICETAQMSGFVAALTVFDSDNIFLTGRPPEELRKLYAVYNVHALLCCESTETVVALREDFYTDVWQHYPKAK